MSIAEKFVSMEYGPAPEDPKEALAWLERHERQFRHFIGGEWLDPAAGEYFDTPIRRQVKNSPVSLRAVAADIDAAVKAARDRALQNGEALLLMFVRDISMLWRAWCRNIRVCLAVLETMDNGKPIRESRDIDIPLVARHFYYHAGWAQLLEQEFPGLRAVRRRRADHSRGIFRC